MSRFPMLGNAFPLLRYTHISTRGVWLLASAQELFRPYDEFPWFKDAPVRSIINVQEVSQEHFCWPDLDVDLSLESIIHPERFPLKAQVLPRPDVQLLHP